MSFSEILLTVPGVIGAVCAIGALPPGQVKQLLKDDTCAAILNKYGITEVSG